MSSARIVFERVGAPERTAALQPPSVAPGRVGWGAAVDVGTTTLTVAAHDLASGEAIGLASALNPQIEFGADVLARVSRALAGAKGDLRDSVAREVERLIGQAGSGARGGPAEVMVVGNPAMLHLLLGRDTAPQAAVPNRGVLTEALEMTAAEAGMPALAGAILRTGPGVSAFVGSDALAGLVASGLADREGPSVLIDLGTNGEIVLKGPEGLVAASAAAGPALEGVSIACGMRAEPGAIERARFADDALVLSTVEDAPPRGICGSGLLDLGAALLAAGAVDPAGRLLMEGPLAESVRVADGGVRLELTGDVHLTQHDIRQLQLAKGAIATALAMVLEEARLSPADVREVVVGGGFGSHVDPASLAAIGMIPAEWTDRVSFGGNTALAGATAMLLDPSVLRAAATLARTVRTVPLAARADFQVRFIGSLDFPPRAAADV
jgi:uncharacterized 2Fe-2S/4Fe-4S cluster protein (DUF4445 family)